MNKKRFPGLITYFFYSFLPAVLIVLFLIVVDPINNLFGADVFFFVWLVVLLLSLQWFLNSYVDQENQVAYIRLYGTAGFNSLFNRKPKSFSEFNQVVDNGSRSIADFFGFGKKRTRFTVDTKDGVINLAAFRKADAKNFASALGIAFIEAN